jgi:hypothetical protein
VFCRYFTEQGLDSTALRERLKEVLEEERRTETSIAAS